ncbi:RNA-binding cell elongation regulator Jag/EloR [Jeotgalibacillus campisalis]|uniref:RNA-binding protein KhpB n=1 Tax=Jeotgalibacillus campisalis TaxID=220754 RepID=A0A0C2SGV9_9BACL|nr:RNA-binding cell elongation regulator Jag/EloR [Jeotgalibacillus campisalis]KIL53194.1 protein jag [Jeotgalibacillus campisalis]
MTQITMTGATVEEAVAAALTKLQISKEKSEVTVIDKGKKGFFGLIGSRPAKVLVKKRVDAVEEVDQYIKDVTRHMGLEIETKIQKKGKNVIFELQSEKVALVIGKRGQTLNSLQYLAQLIANQHSDQFLTITLDAENYRQRRQETLEQLAKKMADQAIRTGRPVKLEPMPSYERKIIHNALTGRRDIETNSEGTEPHRYMMIQGKKNKKESSVSK